MNRWRYFVLFGNDEGVKYKKSKSWDLLKPEQYKNILRRKIFSGAESQKDKHKTYM